MFSQKRFTQALLASSLFVMTQNVYADVTIAGPQLNRTTNTQTDKNITITGTGALEIDAAAATSAVIINSANTLTVGGPVRSKVGALLAPIEFNGVSSGSQIINSSTIETLTTTGGASKVAINALSDFFLISNENGAFIKSVADAAGVAIDINATDGALSGSIVNKAGATIQSKDATIRVSKTYDGSIENSGLFDTTGVGTHTINVLANVNRGITNKATGVIQSANGSGINISTTGSATINNEGVIKSTTGAFAGIQVSGAKSTITNQTTGTIQSVADTAVIYNPGALPLFTTSSLTNNGTITGKNGVLVSGKIVGSVYNDNVITATNGVGVFVNAEITGGITNSNSGEIKGTNDSALKIQGIVNISNDGKLTNTGGAASAVNLNTGAQGVLTNSKTATISAVNQAILVSDSITYDINNTGQIQSGGNTIEIATTKTLNGTITNSKNIVSAFAGAGIRARGNITGGIVNLAGGAIIGKGDAGVNLNGGAALIVNINNSGVIQSDILGVDVNTNASGNISNNKTGIIQATVAGGKGIRYATANASPSSLTNEGIIRGFGTGEAVSIGRAITGTFVNKGVVVSDTGVAVSLDAVAAAGFNGGLINTGTIVGGDGIKSTFAGVAMNITNSTGGTITGITNAKAAINFNTAFTGDILNQGLIQNTSITGNAILINAAYTGTITNDTKGVMRVSNGTDAIAVKADLPAASKIINLGLIDAGTSGFVFKADATKVADFTNTGTLIGKVQMGKGTFNLDPGSNFTGTVQGNDGALSVFSINPGTNNAFSSTGNIDKMGTISVQSGTYALNDTVTNGDAFNVQSKAILQFNNTIALNGAGAAASTLKNISDGQIQVTKAVTLNGKLEQTGINGRIVTTLFDANNFGQINLNNTLNLTGNGTIEIKIGDGYIANGQVFDVIKGATAVINETSKLSVPPSAMVTFAKALNGNDVRITVTRRPMSNISFPHTQQLADVLEQIGLNGTQDPLFRQVLGQLSNAATPEAVRNSLESLSDEVNGARRSVVQSNNSRFGTLISDRLNLVRLNGKTPSDIKGYAAGEGSRPMVAWVQGFGAKAQQKVRKNISGYEARSTGIAAGLDVELCPKLMVGIDAGYVRTGINSANLTRQLTKVKTYLLGAYGSILGDGEYTDMQFTFGTAQYDTTRNIVVGIVNQKGLGDFGGFQFDSRVAHGLMRKWLDWRVTPEAFAQYSYVATKGYIESGAGSLNLRVDNQSHNVFELGFNSRMDYPIESEFGQFIPGFNVGVMWDAFRQRQKSTTSFVGGGTTFVNNGAKPAITSLLIGAGFVMETKQNLDVQVKADLVKKNTFNSQSFNVTMRYKF